MKQLRFRIVLMMVSLMVLSSAPALPAVKAAQGEEKSNSSSTVLAQSSDLKRIRFAPGATSAVVSGDLPARTRARYVLRALAGQLMDVTLTAPQGAALFVTTSAGRPLTPLALSPTAFRGYLPRNADYMIEVVSGEQPASYSVVVSIPQRISFQRGATATSLQGQIVAHQSHDYILRAQAGLLLEINVSPEDNLQLIIYGVDGTVLKSGMGEVSSFRGELPLSQDYIVSLRAGAQAGHFTLNVIIPQRVTFQRGAVSATLKGSLAAHNSQYYVLRGLKGQTMQVDLTSVAPAQLIIYGVDGSVLKSGMGEGPSFSGQLPATQDYFLVVRAGPEAARYTLVVTIR